MDVSVLSLARHSVMQHPLASQSAAEGEMMSKPVPSTEKYHIVVCAKCPPENQQHIPRSQNPYSPWPHLWVRYCPEHGALREAETKEVFLKRD